MKGFSRFVAALFLASALFAPVAAAQRGRVVTTPPPRPMVVTPPVLTQPRLDPPTLVVPRVVVPRVETPRVVAPPPERARPSDGDDGGDDYDSDGDGWTNANDCNDHNSSVHPGAPEVYNGRDDNCDGAAY